MAIGAVLAAQFIGAELLQFQRGGILNGQLWRLLSGHFVHLGWPHALLNLVALGLILAAFTDVAAGPRGAWLVLGSVIAIDLGLLVLQPHIEWYVGLSGVLHGLIAGAAVLTRRRWEGRILLALLVVKLGWEQRFGALPSTAEIAGGPVIVDAHLYGAIGGLITALMLLMHQRRHQAL